MKKSPLIPILVLALLGLIWLLAYGSDNEELEYKSPQHVKVRPSVADAIRRRYAYSNKTRAAALELARQYQIAVSFPDLARQTYKAMDQASSCFGALIGAQSYGESREIEGLVVDTYQRSKSYLKYNALLSGHTYLVNPSSTEDCISEIKTMEN
jgi:hypothetical protein